MNTHQKPTLSDLILIGGGHANIQVMKKLAMNPIGGLRITLVSDKIYAAYSGMLPGFLAEFYDFNQCHFDLYKLCQSYGFRFINGRVIGLDSQEKKIMIHGRPDLAYDWASINVGIEPKEFGTLADNILPIKPISTFVKKWNHWLTDLKTNNKVTTVAVVGGGATGVEVTLILMQLARKHNWSIKVDLFQRGPTLVSKINFSTHRKLLSKLKDSGVEVHLGQEFTKSNDFDKVILTSHAQAPKWFTESNLQVNEQGFLKVDSNLKVLDCKNLFAAGDCIDFTPKSLKKSGVYAVRQGEILAINSHREILGKKVLKSFHPKKNVLSLIIIGPHEATTHQDSFTPLTYLPKSLLWNLKKWIDLRFMNNFSPVKSKMPEPKVFLPTNEWKENTCGGCGSKIGASILSSSMKKLGLSELNDDAAVTITSTTELNLHSIDHFRSFISDPFVFGEISVHHALSDIYAMGGEPKNLLVALSLPPASEKIQSRDLIQIMSGIKNALNESGTKLIGGHTSEGAELAASLSVQGEVKKENLLEKRNLNIGDHLILTKPLGTGVILAAQMERKVFGSDLKLALNSMRLSNRLALPSLRKYQVKNCTDVTGFGLAGHLNEMLADTFSAQLNYSALPQLNGAHELFDQNIRSSISQKNRHALENKIAFDITDLTHPFLFDPQTSGGLLFSISAEKSKDCLASLQSVGFKEAAVIGEVLPKNHYSILLK